MSFGASLPAAATTPPIDQQAIVRQTDDYHELLNKLLDAGGPAIHSMGRCEDISHVRGWLNNGCDLELDILETIRARAKNLPAGSVRSWAYFRDMVANARAARLAPMPEGTAPQPRRTSWQEEEEQRRQKLKAALDKYRKS